MKNKSSARRAQAAVEVLAYASFFLLVFAIVAAVFLQMQGQELSRAENAYAQEIAYGLADSVHTAFIAGPGFSQEVALPRLLLGKQYSMRISSSADLPPNSPISETGFIYVDWQGQTDQSSFSAPAVTASFRAVESNGFIAKNGNFYEINPSTCQVLKMSNIVDTDGKNVIYLTKGCSP